MTSPFGPLVIIANPSAGRGKVGAALDEIDHVLKDAALDHRIVELAYRTPIELKVRANVDKWILRRVVARYLPEWVYARPKQGFHLPLAGWLRGPLRAWAEDLLHPGRLDGLAVPAVRGRWRRHLAGVDDHLYEIWTVLMFQEWRRHRAAISDSPANRDPRATADRVSAIDR